MKIIRLVAHKCHYHFFIYLYIGLQFCFKSTPYHYKYPKYSCMGEVNCSERHPNTTKKIQSDF